MPQYDALKLKNQLCFPLYAASREIVKKYNPYLQELNLTYTQYVAMMVLWEDKSISVSDLGRKLYLDSGTLTPVLKSLAQKGYITRARKKEDERVVMVSVTPSGEKLKESAMGLPSAVAGSMPLSREEAYTLYNLLYKILADM